MTDDRRFYVAEATRTPTGRLFHGASVAECLACIRPRSGPGVPRLAIWMAAAPPDEGPDVALCLPLDVLGSVRDRAAEVVDRWEASWLLIESAPRRHRKEGGEALVELVAIALEVAAVAGLEDRRGVEF